MTTPANWYPDPENPSAWRYWDGSQWTEHRSGPPAKRKRGAFFWVFWAVQALFVAWIVVGIAGQPEPECEFLTASECQDAADVGTALGVMLIVFFWAAVDVVLGVIYLVRRK